MLDHVHVSMTARFLNAGLAARPTVWQAATWAVWRTGAMLKRRQIRGRAAMLLWQAVSCSCKTILRQDVLPLLLPLEQPQSMPARRGRRPAAMSQRFQRQHTQCTAPGTPWRTATVDRRAPGTAAAAPAEAAGQCTASTAPQQQIAQPILWAQHGLPAVSSTPSSNLPQSPQPQPGRVAAPTQRPAPLARRCRAGLPSGWHAAECFVRAIALAS